MAAEEAVSEYRKQMADEAKKDAEQKQKEELEQFKTFLQDRVGALKESGDLTAERLRQDAEVAANIQAISDENRVAAEKALNQELNLISDDREIALAEALKAMGQTRAQAEQEQLDQFTQFLTARFEAEKLTDEERLVYFEEQKNLMLANMQLEEDEKLALQKAANKLTEKEEKRLADAEVAIMNKKVSAMGGLLSSLSSLIQAVGQDSVAAAVLSKVISAAQAAINSYVAYTYALNDITVPSAITRMGIAKMVLASGLIQQAAIWATPIPGAETGGYFEVPDTGRVDGHLLRVNRGEGVNITPRGMTGEDAAVFNINLLFDGQILAYANNKLARAGELYTLQLAGNL
jgi:hypothetical protein